jgi:hypothetical protein
MPESVYRRYIILTAEATVRNLGSKALTPAVWLGRASLVHNKTLPYKSD